MTRLRPGDRAPAFGGECSDGEYRTLAGYAGRSLVLVFHRHLG